MITVRRNSFWSSGFISLVIVSPAPPQALSNSLVGRQDVLLFILFAIDIPLFRYGIVSTFCILRCHNLQGYRCYHFVASDEECKQIGKNTNFIV